MSLNGTFEFKSHNNFDGWLKAFGFSDEVIAAVTSKHKHELTQTDTSLTVKTTLGDNVENSTFIFGQDSEAELAGIKYTMNVTANSKGFSGTMKMKCKTSTVCVEVNDDGFIETSEVDGIKGTKTYVRV